MGLGIGIPEAVSTLMKVVDKFIPDPQAKIEAEKELRDSLMAWDQQQTSVNAIEAANSNVFVSGWRPFIGWICGFGLAYAFLIRPIFSPFIQQWAGIPLGDLDFGTLNTILLGMLGMGGMRTYEKIKGVASK